VTLADYDLVTQHLGASLGGDFGALAVAAVPEPSGLGLLACAGLVLLRGRRRVQ
jgi:hypothetical protein